MCVCVCTCACGVQVYVLYCVRCNVCEQSCVSSLSSLLCTYHLPLLVPGLLPLQITGMTCASCVSLIERATKKLPGVYSAAVALTGRGHFEYDPHLVHPRDIIRAVEVLACGMLDLYLFCVTCT